MPPNAATPSASILLSKLKRSVEVGWEAHMTLSNHCCYNANLLTGILGSPGFKYSTLPISFRKPYQYLVVT